MATASDSLPNITSSPRSSSSDAANNSPRFRKNPRNLSSPWANIVRGESDSLPAPSSPSSSSSAIMIAASKDQITDSDSSSLLEETTHLDVSDTLNSNAAKSKKPAWNKPSNGAAVDATPPVMGAASWPALSESAKASPKSSSESLKALSDGSTSVPQGPIIPESPKKPVNATANPNSTGSHQFPTRQKSFNKRGGGGGSASAGGSSSNNSSSQSQLNPPPQAVEVPHRTGPVVHGTSPRDAPHRIHNFEGGQRTGMVSQQHVGNDTQHQRNSFRRGGGGGGGGHHRGDGSNHYNHGNRRDQDRGNHDSNPSHRGFNVRDGYMQPRVNQRNFVRPMQPSTAPFISPPPVRPFVNPLGFPGADMASPVYYIPTPPQESFRGVPFFHAAPIMIVPGPDAHLRSVILRQIEYYFSPDNLCKDTYLRKHMDAQGWVPISVIANFNLVKQWSNNIQFIVESVRTSTLVEVQGEKIRKRNDWMNWILPCTNLDSLANRIQEVGLEEGSSSNGYTKNSADAHPHALSKSSS